MEVCHDFWALELNFCGWGEKSFENKKKKKKSRADSGVRERSFLGGR